MNNKPEEVEEKTTEPFQAKKSSIGGFLNKFKKNQPQTLPNKNRDSPEPPKPKIEATIFKEEPKITEEIEVG